MSALINFIKDLPLARQLRRTRYERFFASAENMNLFRGVFPDFASAEKSSPVTKRVGYDNDESAGMYNEYFEHLAPRDYSALFWLEKLQGQVKSIYDFGGHVGIKYYAYSRVLSEADRIRWTVFDVPAVVQRGRRIAKERGLSALDFSDDVKDLEQGYDLLFASGSLQYLEDPFTLIFKDLRNKPKFVLINNLPVHDTLDYVTLQNISTAFCPYRIFAKETVIQRMREFGYELSANWENAEKDCIVPFTKGHSLNHYKGYLFTLSPSL